MVSSSGSGSGSGSVSGSGSGSGLDFSSSETGVSEIDGSGVLELDDSGGVSGTTGTDWSEVSRLVFGGSGVGLVKNHHPVPVLTASILTIRKRATVLSLKMLANFKRPPNFLVTFF